MLAKFIDTKEHLDSYRFENAYITIKQGCSKFSLGRKFFISEQQFSKLYWDWYLQEVITRLVTFEQFLHKNEFDKIIISDNQLNRINALEYFNSNNKQKSLTNYFRYYLNKLYDELYILTSISSIMIVNAIAYMENKKIALNDVQRDELKKIDKIIISKLDKIQKDIIDTIIVIGENRLSLNNSFINFLNEDITGFYNYMRREILFDFYKTQHEILKEDNSFDKLKLFLKFNYNPKTLVPVLAY